MSESSPWEHFFKPEVRKAGSDLLRKGVVFLKPSSDTQVEATVRASTPAKISFRSPSISSHDFTVDCNCPASRKGQFCKHIWATLLMVKKDCPDFLETKNDIKKRTTAPSASSEAAVTAGRMGSQRRQLDYKQRQADYRKKTYQDQKHRLKQSKKDSRVQESTGSRLTSSLSDDVQLAIRYFEENGFPMQPPFQEAAINHAKRILSKVFHPDKGGTHAEVLDLLKHAETLLSNS